MSFAVSPTVTRIVRGDLCTGCGLCASVSSQAITMENVAPGYNRPVQRVAISAEAEEIIAASCPGAVVAPWPQAPTTHVSWGPYYRVATGFATDPAVRHQGSSGGAITAIAVDALRSGLVDRVVHVMANPTDPAGNMIVVSDQASQVIEGAGSRYVASSPLNHIDEVLSDGGSFAFIGKPCDVSALRQLGRLDPRVDAHVPLMLAFFCAGIPSRQAVRGVLSSLEVDPEDLTAFRFRGNGWPGKAAATTKDGRIVEMSYEDSWGGHLSKGVQFRCKICPDAAGGSADISCADAWYGGESGYPSFEELDGRSLIMTRTPRGEAVLDQALARGAITAEPLDINEIDLMQPSQARRKRLVESRTAALIATLRPKPVMRGLRVEQAARSAGFFEQGRSFLGAVRRSLSRT